MAGAIKWIAFLCGLAVVGWLVAQTDLTAVADDVAELGWLGALVVIVTFFVGFSADVGAWLLMFTSVAVDWVGMRRIWLVQMVGEAVNTLLPFGSLGGEPVKAMLLKRQYGISYREATASIISAQAINTLAEVPFIGGGLVMMLSHRILPPAAETAMMVACACVAVFIAVVFLALHLRLLVALERRLTASRWGLRLRRGLNALRDIEQQLFTFVRHRPGRFTASVFLAFITWLSGAAEVFIMLRFLGVAVSWQDAWLVEAAVVLVRNATFFVPAHMGSQDAVIVFVIESLTGASDLGLAIALLRRGREIFTSSIGLAIGGWFGLRPGMAMAELSPQEEQHG